MRYLNEDQRKSNVNSYVDNFLSPMKSLYPHLTVKIKERSADDYMALQRASEDEPMPTSSPPVQKSHKVSDLSLEDQIARSKKILADPDMHPIHGKVRDNMYERIKQLEARNKLGRRDE